MKKRRLLLVLSVMLLFFMTFSMPADAASAKMNCKKKSLLVGQSFQLVVRNTSQTAIWSTSNQKVARVTSSGVVTARKRGTAVITAKIGKKKYTCTITVKDVVDVIVFAGQSNMTGVGDAVYAPELITGAGFAYNYVTDRNTLSPLTEPFGYGQDDTYFFNGDYARGSMVTAFVNAYYAQTKTPVIAVPAASAGTGSCSWEEFRYKGIIQRVNAAVRTAKKKGLTVGHVYMVWMQGENDALAGMTTKLHISNLKSIVKKVKKKTQVEACMIIGLPSYYNDPEIGKAFKRIRTAQKNLCDTNSDFVLISTRASSLSGSYQLEDGIHLKQGALNIIGKQAGTNAGKYAKSN